MRWMAVLCALTMLMACNKDNDKSKKSNTANQAEAQELTLLQKANSLADKVCACPDAACFQALETEGDAMAASMDAAMATASDADKEGFMAAMTRVGECAEKLAGGGEEAATALDEAAAGVEAVAAGAEEAVKAAVPADLNKAVNALKALEGAAPALGKAAAAINAVNAINGKDLGSDLKNAAVAVDGAAGLAEKAGLLNSDQAAKLKCQAACTTRTAECTEIAGKKPMKLLKCAKEARSCLGDCN